MNNFSQPTSNEVKENVVAGIVGAFLFSLVGGVLWFVIYMIGFVAAISGLVGAVCAIKGYSLFAKKESIKGIIISVVISLLVMVAAWYFCLSYDVYDVYRTYFEEGYVSYAPTFFESVQNAHIFLTDPEIASAYYRDLVMGLLFCLIGGGSYVVNKIRSVKQKAAVAQFGAAAPSETVFPEAPDTNTDNTSNDQ